MDKNEYLNGVLASQGLAEDSAELKELQSQRAAVEDLLRKKFGSGPTIRYGGSKAKGTLIREACDLDVICYFPHDDTSPGEALEDIYKNVRDALAEKYVVKEKTSVLRLKSKDPKDSARDFHVDVVPGRYTDETKTDCFIYQKSAEKQRLKTNLEAHIGHVKESGVLDPIRLLKLWKVRKGLAVKQFVFELLIIKLLQENKPKTLADQMTLVWKKIVECSEPPAVEDPANPNGNDLSSFLRAAWQELSSVAKSTLSTIETSGWESVYGPVGESARSTRVGDLRAAAAAVNAPSKPWCVGQ